MPIVFHYGEQDSHIPQTAVKAVKERFAGKPNAVFFDYPDADHGFNCWGRRQVYNQRSAALALGRSLEFLSQHL
jgi:carboxymethylenebutenolidase